MDQLTIKIEKDEDGYFAKVVEMPGCMTQGDSLKEVLENIYDAIECWKKEVSR